MLWAPKHRTLLGLYQPATRITGVPGAGAGPWLSGATAIRVPVSIPEAQQQLRFWTSLPDSFHRSREPKP